MKIISTLPKLIFFKTIDLYTLHVYSLNMQTTLKHYQLRKKGEIFISLAIILKCL